MICKLVIYLFYIKLIYISSLTFPGHNQQEEDFYDSKMWSALTMCYLLPVFTLLSSFCFLFFKFLFSSLIVSISLFSSSSCFYVSFQFLLLCFFLVTVSIFYLLPLNSLLVFLVPVSSFLSSSCFFISFQFLVLHFFLVLVSLFLSSS